MYPVLRGASKRWQLWPLLTADDIRAVYLVSKQHNGIVVEAWRYVKRRVALSVLADGPRPPIRSSVVEEVIKDPLLVEDLKERIRSCSATT